MAGLCGLFSGAEYKTERTWYPPLGRVLEDAGETVPTLRRISERRSEEASPTFPPLTRPVRPGETLTYTQPPRRISERSPEAPAPTPLPYRRISERAPIESAIHDDQIKVTDPENLLTEAQKKILLERMQEVHTFFYEKFGIEAVRPVQLFPPINGSKEDPDNADWSNNVKEGWHFGSRSISLETVAHEYIHAIVQRMTKLRPGEGGALNESLADVFASIFKQYKAGQSVEKADWLMTDEGKTYRSVKAVPEGIKYPKLTGEEHDDAVIPNYAFYTAAMAIKGNSWDVIGRIWCEALKNTKRSQGVMDSPPFVAFCQATITATEKLFPKKQFPQYATIVREAWAKVGVPSAIKDLLT